MSIQKKDATVERYLQYYLLRRNDEYNEEQVATKLGFASHTTLYKQLAQDGFPVCPVCGETPTDPKHCKRRKPRHQDEKIVKLPPAADAISLFERVIGRPRDEEEQQNIWARFATGLHKLYEDLMHLDEELHGKRFVSNKVYRNENDPPFEGTLRREDFSEEQWARICAEFGQYYSTDKFTYYDTPEAPTMVTQGASKNPWRGLTVLISTYLLMGRPVEPLLDVLHPDSSRVTNSNYKSI